MGKRALAVARPSHDQEALANALDGAKTGFAYLGELVELEPILAESEPLLRRSNDLWRLQWTVFESSFPHIAAAKWQSATARIEAALAVNRRSGYASYEGCFTAYLGWLARLQGHDDDAVGHGRRALVASAGHSWWSATAAAMLATTLFDLGATEEAVEVLRSSPMGHAQDGTKAYRLRYLAALAEATGSAEVLVEADGLLAEIDAPVGGAWLLGVDAYLGVARAWLAASRPDRAVDSVALMLAAAERVGWVGARAEALLVTGRCALMSGEPAAARTAFDQAQELAARHGMAGVQRASRDLLATLA